MEAIVPFVSVIMCTRNRSESLRRTLNSVCRAAAHVSDDWELLVVDNGSSDDTPATIASFAGRLPVRRIWEETPGLSNARNAGVRACRGQYVVWTDDDVLVDEQWLAAWFRGFRQHPDCAVFGGRALPKYEEPVQNWFQANEGCLASLLAIRNTTEWRDVTRHQVPYGLNYAIRAIEQRTHLYDPELGVAPGRRRGGEETAVIRAILAEGGTGVWIWDALVYHLIPPQRQSEDYIQQFYRAGGYDYPLGGLRSGVLAKMIRILRLLATWCSAKVNYRRQRQFDRSASIPHLVMVARAEGSLRRYLRLKPF